MKGVVMEFCFVFDVSALRELFHHYVEAWSSWYSEVAGKNPVEVQS